MTRAALLVVCACGRIGFDPRDGGTADSASPFGTPHVVTEIASPDNDITPALSADELDIMFSTEREGLGHYTLWEATRMAPTDTFAPPAAALLPGTNGTSEPALTDDGLELIFRRNGSALAVSTRTSRGAPWSTPVIVTELTGFDAADFIGDLRLVLSGSPDGALYETTRVARDMPWGQAQALAGLDPPANVVYAYPTASADGLEVFFQTEPTGSPVQLARAVRPSLAEPFGAVEPIDVGFPTVTVGDPELTHDGHTLYFVAANGTGGTYEIYAMTR